MALFGAPVTAENDAEMAVRTALAMQDALRDFNIEHALDLGLHTGISTGRVLAGDVGSSERSEYTVMGAAVNLGSRLCDAGGPGDILLAAETYKLTRHLFHFDVLEPRHLQGIAEPVPLYRALGARTVAKDRGSRSSALLAGRASELAVLARLFEEAGRGHFRRAMVTGDAGIGKSRLIAESVARSGAGCMVASMHGLAHMATVSDWAARELLRGLLACPSTASPRTVGTTLDTVLTAGGATDRDAVYVPLAYLAGAELGDDDHRIIASLGPEVLRRRIHSAFGAILDMCAAVAPVVLVCEDLHWWDVASLDILCSLHESGHEGVLVLMTSRTLASGASAALRDTVADPGAVALELGALGADACSDILDSLLGADIGADLRNAIVERADGNAFFLEELAHTVTHNQAGDVPATVEGVVAARIDRLAATDKQLLQTAAVIGRTFGEAMLKEVDDHAARDVATSALRRRRISLTASVPARLRVTCTWVARGAKWCTNSST